MSCGLRTSQSPGLLSPVHSGSASNMQVIMPFTKSPVNSRKCNVQLFKIHTENRVIYDSVSEW